MTPIRRLGKIPAVNKQYGGLLGGDSVQDHRDRRRDDDGNRARRGDQANRKALVVTARLERGIDHPAHRHDGADGGVRHRAEQFRRGDRCHGERAAHAADHGHHHGDDPPRNAALRHDLAGQHEEWHSQQRKVVEAAEHIGLDRLGRHVGDGQYRYDRGHEQNEEDRKADHQQDHWQREVDEIGHRRCLPNASRRRRRLGADVRINRTATSNAIKL